MKKSEELYVKHLYSSVTDQEEEYANKKQQEVVINEEIREDQGTKRNAKNRIIEVVMEEVKTGILTVTKENQIQVIIVKNRFLPK